MAGESGYLGLGGVTIPDTARLDWSQTRERLDACERLEYSDGSAEIQRGPWAAGVVKRLVAITCSGWQPPGLDALDRTATHTLTWEEPTDLSTWTTRTMTCWIWEPPRYTDNPRAPGGGSVAWTITLREA